MNGASDVVVAKYQVKELDPSKIESMIAEAWLASLQEFGDEISNVLQVDCEKLKASETPFKVVVKSSGFNGSEIVVIFATALFVEVAKEIVKDAGAAVGAALADKFRLVWRRYVRQKIVEGGNKIGRDLEENPENEN